MMSKQDLSQVEEAFARALVSLGGQRRKSRGEYFPPRGSRVIVDHAGGESA